MINFRHILQGQIQRAGACVNQYVVVHPQTGGAHLWAINAARAAEYGLFSAGPDKQYDPFVRSDDAGRNEDNIVRFGP
jgi:hypothetical protein